MICTPFTGHPVEGEFLCAIAMSTEVGNVAEDLINRDFSTTAPLQKWTTDVSQFHFSWGKCYLSPILDMHTNEIISYDLALSPNLGQIQRMLNRAFEKLPSLSGLIMHSDQGWQYRHAYYRSQKKTKWMPPVTYREASICAA